MKYVAIFASLLFISACDSANDADDAPPVYLESMFEVDTDVFQSGSPKSAAGFHFTNAALRVWPVSLVLTASLAMPAAVTHAATQVDPVFEDGAWRWVHSATNGTQSVEFNLSATPTSPGHDWSMLVSYADGENQITDFELFTAHTENNGTEGNWQLYLPEGEDGAESLHVLDAEFNKDSETDKQLTFSIPDDAADNAGDSVTYTEDGDIHTFTWIQVDADIDTYVEWDNVTGVGSITASNYNSGLKACWDASFEDIVCSD